jgi:hypothetical protein
MNVSERFLLPVKIPGGVPWRLPPPLFPPCRNGWFSCPGPPGSPGGPPPGGPLPRAHPMLMGPGHLPGVPPGCPSVLDGSGSFMTTLVMVWVIVAAMVAYTLVSSARRSSSLCSLLVGFLLP